MTDSNNTSLVGFSCATELEDLNAQPDFSLESVLKGLSSKMSKAACQRALLLARDENGLGYCYNTLLRALRTVRPQGGSLKTLPWYASKMKKEGLPLPAKRARRHNPKNRALTA